MFELPDVIQRESISPLPTGTNLLISGPAMVGKQALALDVLAAGLEQEHGLLIISTDENAQTCVEELEARISSFDRERVGVVDCSGTTQQETIRDVATQRVSAPDDLTGISIGTTKLMERFVDQELSGVRHGLVSVSTLLQYLELDTVFKFLHIYTQRVNDTDGLGVFTVDNSSYDAQTISTITGEFDAMIELRETESGREVRFKGIAGISRTWNSF